MLKKKRRGNSGKYRSSTMNITPILLKLTGVLVLMYLLYSAWFLYTWGILPYTFGYTVYMVEEDYQEYGIEKNDFLIIKYVDYSVDNDLVLLREGVKYKISDGSRRPYGLIVSRDIADDLVLFFDKLKNIFSFR